MTPRIYVEPPCEDAVTLDPRQSHHLVRVLRLRTGDALELFDGTGRVWRARVAHALAKACAIDRGPLIGEAAPGSPEINLAQALLKSDAMDRLIRQATELGVTRIRPLTSARTRTTPDRAQSRYDHWRRIIIGACEQSRRLHLPRLQDTRGFAGFIDEVPAANTLLLHPQGGPLPRDLPKEQTTVLVGPEGGWAAGEVSRAKARGIDIFSLGAVILRAETVPLAAIAAIRHSWGWN